MTTSRSALERQYRRLLRSYPHRFRDQHGEELLGVLLDGAGEGQRFARPLEAANLVTNGVRARFHARRLAAGDTGRGEREVSWGDALATANVHGLGPAPVGSWPFPPWMRWLKWLPALLAVVAVAVGIPYVFFDHALAGYGGRGSSVGAAGQTTYHGLPVRPAGAVTGGVTTLDLRSVRPRVVLNTARASVSIVVCSGPVAAALVYGGSLPGNPATYCPRLSAFRPGHLGLGTSVDAGTTTGVLVAVTPRQAGTVRIEGADVSYRQGIRYGHQHVGMDWTLRVP